MVAGSLYSRVGLLFDEAGNQRTARPSWPQHHSETITCVRRAKWFISGLQNLTNLNLGVRVQADMRPDSGFQSAARSQHSILTMLEKRVLIWIAHRLPTGVNSDHLTVLGFLS